MKTKRDEEERLLAKMEMTKARIRLLERQRAELLVAAASLTPAQLNACLAALRDSRHV